MYYLVGGFNPSQKHSSVGVILPNVWKNNPVMFQSPPSRYLHRWLNIHSGFFVFSCPFGKDINSVSPGVRREEVQVHKIVLRGRSCEGCETSGNLDRGWSDAALLLPGKIVDIPSGNPL